MLQNHHWISEYSSAFYSWRNFWFGCQSCQPSNILKYWPICSADLCAVGRDKAPTFLLSATCLCGRMGSVCWTSDRATSCYLDPQISSHKDTSYAPRMSPPNASAIHLLLLAMIFWIQNQFLMVCAGIMNHQNPKNNYTFDLIVNISFTFKLIALRISCLFSKVFPAKRHCVFWYSSSPTLDSKIICSSQD